MIYYSLIIVMAITQFGLILTPILGSLSGIVRIISGFVLLPVFLYLIHLTKTVKLTWLFFCAFALYMLVLNLLTEYGIIPYLYLLPAYVIFPVIFPLLSELKKKDKIKYDSIIKLFFYSNLTLMLGVILDYLFSLNELFNLPIVQDGDSTVRASFLLASPTATFVMGATGLLVYYANTNRNRNRNNLEISLFLITWLVAAFLSFSRLPLILTILSIFLYFLFSNVRFRFKLIMFIIATIIFISFSTDILDVFSQYTTKLLESFSLNDVGNNQRSEYWFQALNTFSEPTYYFGAGFGSASINLAKILGFRYIGHFESSLFLMWIETGIFGLALAIYSIKFVFNNDLFISSVCGLILINLLIVPLYYNYQIPFAIIFCFSVITYEKTNQKKY